MADKSDPLLYALLGIAVGAVAVYIWLTQMNKTTITELVRDDKGHVISIVEKRV